ncbi:MAG: hypothetical protein N3D19_04225, partial [Archaeoglobaceae archaeon]|nr:hypothetical protein [Archaeoglobaceae archaeon]
YKEVSESRKIVEDAKSQTIGVVSVVTSALQPAYENVVLHVKLPKGKFSDFYRGVLGFLEDHFEETEVEIRIVAKKGKISKSDYENKVRETLSQIKAKMLYKKLE